MRDWQSQSHVKHYRIHHRVFVPKYREKRYSELCAERSERYSVVFAAKQESN